MTYPEEDIARALGRQMREQLTKLSPPADVAVNGAGVHWQCTATRFQSHCSTSCFDCRNEGPEYLTVFLRNSEMIAWGRTSSSADAIAAVHDWLSGAELSQIYERFPFVEQTKRALTRLRDEIVATISELGKTGNIHLDHSGCDQYSLEFRLADRSCQINYNGRTEYPDASFRWDECELFRFRAEHADRFAAVLKSWLCDHAQPSQMRAQFEWLQMGPLADHYEFGNPVLGEFLQSWDSMERYFSDRNGMPMNGLALEFIARLRVAGYDRRLRAGQSLYYLVVSRSRRHHLRPDQASIAFGFRDGVMDVFIRPRGQNERKVKGLAVELSDPVQSALEDLANEPVD